MTFRTPLSSVVRDIVTDLDSGIRAADVFLEPPARFFKRPLRRSRHQNHGGLIGWVVGLRKCSRRMCAGHWSSRSWTCRASVSR